MKRRTRVIYTWILIAVSVGLCVYSLLAYRRRGIEIMQKSSSQMLEMLASEKCNVNINYINRMKRSMALVAHMADDGANARKMREYAQMLGFDGIILNNGISGESVDISNGRMSMTCNTAKGTLTCYINPENTEGIFDSADSENRYYSFVVDKYGNILSPVKHEGFINVAQNTIDFYREAVLNDGMTAEKVLESLEAGQKGSLSYVYGSRANNVCWMPLGINDWSLFVVATSELTDEGRKDIDRRVTGLGLSIAAAFALYVVAVGLMIRRVNDKYSAEKELLAIREQTLALIKNLSFTIIFDCDLKTGDIEYNESFVRQLGRKPSITNLSQLESDDADPRLRSMAQEMRRGSPKGKVSVQLPHANGSLIWYQIHYECVYVSGKTAPDRVVGRIANIEWHDHEQDAQTSIVEHDALTGLLGHTTFMRKCEKQLKAASYTCAMMIIDIDDFKIVSQSNAGYGGDELIVRMSDAMRRVFSQSALMGRISGDVFAVMFTRDTSVDHLAQKALSLEKEFGKTGCTCSIGIAVTDETVKSIAELCSRADKALYRVKLLGKHGYQFFDGTSESDTPMEDETDANALLLKCVINLTTVKDVEESTKFVLRQTAVFYDAASASILLCDDQNAKFVESAVYRREKTTSTAKLEFTYSQAPFAFDSLKKHKPLSLSDNDKPTGLLQGEIDIVRRRGEKSVYLVPLGESSAMIGFLVIANPKYHVGNVSFMRTLARCIGCDIEKRRGMK